jgi:hypothetical protein
LTRCRQADARSGSSSHEVLRPSSAQTQQVGVIAPVPPGTPSLLGLSQTLEGLVLATPCGLVACR